MADVQNATMTGEPRALRNWPNGILGLVALNWPLLLLWLPAPIVHMPSNTLIVLAVAVAAGLSVTSLCLSRRYNLSGMTPVLLAGAMSLLVLITVVNTNRSIAFDRAVEVQSLPSADANFPKGQMIRLAGSYLDFQRVVWQDMDRITLFPLRGHNTRTCVAPIRMRGASVSKTTEAWGVVSLKLTGVGDADCQSTAAFGASAEPLVLQHQSTPSAAVADLAKRVDAATPAATVARTSFWTVIKPPMISAEWIRALLAVVVILLNVALIHVLRLEGHRSKLVNEP